jgi:formate-dependent nitrite reductase membrane component NrfD
MEITITGANALTTPNLHIWDWRVSLYLFLGGLAAGLAVMSSILYLRKEGKLEERENARYLAPILVPVILSLGMLFIFWDLERKLNVYWIYLTVQPLSPMSWGSWGLLAFFPLTIAYALASLPDSRLDWLVFRPAMNFALMTRPYRRHLAITNLLMGIFIGIYTGVLLSSFVARPLWNSALLPTIFLASALSAGAAMMIILARQKKVKLFFTKLDALILLAEMTLLPLFFYGQYTSSASHRLSILPFVAFTHEYFWYGAALIFVGVVFPFALILKMLEIKDPGQHEMTPAVVLRMNISALLVLVGALVIRLSFVYAGQLSKFS